MFLGEYTSLCVRSMRAVHAQCKNLAYLANHTAIASHMHELFRQTNNPAEVMAALRALQLFTSGEIAVCTDSECVILGTAGAARRWQLRGWKGSSELVSNVSLWEQLLTERERLGRVIHWVKVPSHVTIEGNNEADCLAERGHVSHPRVPAPATPAFHSPLFRTPKAPKSRRLSVNDFSPLKATTIFFSPPSHAVSQPVSPNMHDVSTDCTDSSEAKTKSTGSTATSTSASTQPPSLGGSCQEDHDDDLYNTVLTGYHRETDHRNS